MGTHRTASLITLSAMILLGLLMARVEGRSPSTSTGQPAPSAVMDDAALPAAPQAQEQLGQQADAQQQQRGQLGQRGGRGQRGTRGRGGRGRGGIAVRGMYKAQVDANWFDQNSKFWYRNNLRDDKKEFILVDAERGSRQRAFDHAKLAEALGRATNTTVEADKLPFDQISFVDGVQSVVVGVGGKAWKCNLSTYAVTETTSPTQIGSILVPAPNELETEIDIARAESVWGDGPIPDWDLLARTREELRASPYWEGDLYPPQLTQEASAQAQARGAQGQRDGRGAFGQRGGGRGGRGFAPTPTEEEPLRSPDEKWAAFVRDLNVFVRPLPGGQEKQLSTDGTEGNAYGRLDWSPDSATLVAWRVEPGQPNPVYVVQHAPPYPTDENDPSRMQDYTSPFRPDLSNGPAVLNERNYPQPGIKGTMLELSVFDVANARQTKPRVDRVDISHGSPSPRWKEDGSSFTYEMEDRGHVRYRIIEINARAGTARTILDDQTDEKHRWIWTVNTEGRGGYPLVTYLDETNEIVYTSEMDGWRHHWLIDAASGKKTCMTPGPWPVRGQQDLDVENRVLWFSASGIHPDQDPYLQHFGRVNFDGTGLVWLTEGNGQHSIAYSPDRKYIVDSYNRVDMPPVSELRRVADGKLVCELEQADVSQIQDEGNYHPAEVFVAKGRDGVTDIWGIICRPVNFDPNKKYPVVENIYAGPQDFFTPKTFSTAARYADVSQHGFIVVKVDGMGLPGRSAAIHNVAWRNLKDAGFPDRIAWMKAAAEKYPYMDLDRVGVYGGSAGGQNALGALLFHPEFYKVAVANCGCHDNRIDKQSWNEQWMSYNSDIWNPDPEVNWYAASSNVDNAWRLQGKLLLIVADGDTNVPPESTFRVVNALVQSQKDFDLLVVPNAGHGAGSPITQRRLQDFFRMHLLDETIPNRNPETADAPPTGRAGGRGGVGRGGTGARRGDAGGRDGDAGRRGGAGARRGAIVGVPTSN